MLIVHTIPILSLKQWNQARAAVQCGEISKAKQENQLIGFR